LHLRFCLYCAYLHAGKVAGCISIPICLREEVLALQRFERVTGLACRRAVTFENWSVIPARESRESTPATTPLGQRASGGGAFGLLPMPLPSSGRLWVTCQQLHRTSSCCARLPGSLLPCNVLSNVSMHVWLQGGW
jgi:hypothetical protein